MREKIKKIVLLHLIVFLTFLVVSCEKKKRLNPIPDPVNPPVIKTKVYGLNFSPYVEGQDPSLGSVVSQEQLRERIGIIAPFTNGIRSFGSTHGLENTGRIAREFNLKTAMGAWLNMDLETNQIEMQNLIQAAKDGYVDLAIVGGEVLLRGDLLEDQLIDYIEWFREEVPEIPVATNEVYGVLLNHPRLMDASDVILVNYYPYWEGIDVNKATAYLHARHQEVVAKADGKEVIVAETGWPSDGDQIGDAVPSPENASFYFLNFVSWARAEGVDFYYFEAFDEKWKAQYEGPQGAYWGVWDQYGNMKDGMQDVFDGQTVPDNWTCREMPGGAGDPVVEFTHVPFYGSFENLEGQVWHVWPEDYRVAVYINVDGGWWTKPYWDNPLTAVECGGNWIYDITTGGIDETAIEIAAYLVPVDYEPPLAAGESVLPSELEQNSVAWIKETRSP